MRVLHISDLHVESAPERRQPGVLATLERDSAALRAAGADLVLVTGDLTTYGYAEIDALALAKEWLDDLDVAYLAVAGNHDLAPLPFDDGVYNDVYEDVSYADTGYGRVFGAEPVRERDLGGFRVIGADLREGDVDNVLPRLAQVLAADSRPVVLATHYPVVPTRDTRIHEYFGSDAFIPTTMGALADLIGEHRNVVVYACGHVHVNSARPLAPHCLQLTAGSLGQGAATYRILDFDDRGVTYSTLLGSGPLEFWGAAADTAGPDFHLGGPDDRTGRWDWPDPR